MLDQIGAVVVIAAIVVNLGTVATALRVSLFARLAFLALSGLWIGGAIALAASGLRKLLLAAARPVCWLHDLSEFPRRSALFRRCRRPCLPGWTRPRITARRVDWTKVQ